MEENKTEKLKEEVKDELNKLILKLKDNSEELDSFLKSTKEVLELLVDKHADPEYILEQYYNSSCYYE